MGDMLLKASNGGVISSIFLRFFRIVLGDFKITSRERWVIEEMYAFGKLNG